MNGSRPGLVVVAALVLIAALTAVVAVFGPGLLPGSPPVPVAPWDVVVTSDIGKQMRVRVVDETGGLVGARPGQGDPAFGDALALAIGQRADPRVVTVGYVALTCDREAELRLLADRRTMELTFAPRGVCDAMGVGYVLELEFREAVDPATLDGRVIE